MKNNELLAIKDSIINDIRNWFDENGPESKAIIGISGGKDSTVSAALLVEALGKDRVIGVLMPNGIQSDIIDSKKIVNFLDINSMTINISDMYNAFIRRLGNEFEVSEDTKINLPPRIRMSILYGIAQSMNGRVINTCNYSEDYVGYSTKYGDSAGDISILGNLLVREIIELGDILGLPYDLVHKAPSDGLCGKTDEDRFGFTYNDIETYIRNGTTGNEDIDKKIEYMHNSSRHKYKDMYICFNNKSNI